MIYQAALPDDRALTDTAVYQRWNSALLIFTSPESITPPWDQPWLGIGGLLRSCNTIHDEMMLRLCHQNTIVLGKQWLRATDFAHHFRAHNVLGFVQHLDIDYPGILEAASPLYVICTVLSQSNCALKSLNLRFSELDRLTSTPRHDFSMALDPLPIALLKVAHKSDLLVHKVDTDLNLGRKINQRFVFSGLCELKKMKGFELSYRGSGGGACKGVKHMTEHWCLKRERQ